MQFVAGFATVGPNRAQARERWRMQIDRDWFLKKLDEKDKSVRGLARHLDIDASAVSRMLSGQRRMKMEEAGKIALFIGATVKEVLSHAGVAVDLDGLPTRVLLTSTIDERGRLKPMSESRPLPQSVIERAQAAIGKRNDKVLAAQIRASSGPLALLDDAVLLFAPTDIVDPAAVGTLSICRTKDGDQVLARLERSRKTGESSIRRVIGEPTEVVILNATPVLAILP